MNLLNRSKIKLLLQKIGLFAIARKCYRKLDQRHREELKANERFYSEFIKVDDLFFDNKL